MKSFLSACLLLLTLTLFGQETSDRVQIENTLNNYVDAFYKGDTTKLKLAIKPRLNKFGYWKNKDSGKYEYYAHMSYEKAMAFVQKMNDEGKTRDENEIRNVEVLDIGNHIASAKVTAAWGVDYVQLSKDNGNWMIEQVIWEGPYEKATKQTTSTYYLIRHAEKDQSDKSNRNPHLTDEGKNRAQNWANILEDVKFDAVYSTDYHRTKETAMPTAEANGLELSFYDPRNMDIASFTNDTNGKTVLIVGHSNTTPMFTNGLIGKKQYKMIDESNNANLYIVTITKDSKTSTLLKVD